MNFSTNSSLYAPFVNDCISGNESVECYEYRQNISPIFEGVIYFVYGSIFLFALFGNGIVCYIVCSSPRMRTVTNYFIVNLAVGDILMTCFCIPFSFVPVLLLQYWPFGPELCPVVSYSQAVSVMVSAYTLIAISIDRYIAIIYPLKPRMTRLQAKVTIFFVWLFALLTALPIAIVTKLVQPMNDRWFSCCDKSMCMEEWSDQDNRYYYSMALLFLQYFIPLTALIVTYTRIAIVVWGKKTPGEAEDSRDQRMAKSKRKMIKMMLAVVCIFSLCWLPFHTLLICGDLHEEIWRWPPIRYFWFAAHWLAMSHTCYNPIIYCWLNNKFRHGFRQIVKKIPFCRRLVPKNESEEMQFMRRVTMHTTLTTGRSSVRTRMSSLRKSMGYTECQEKDLSFAFDNKRNYQSEHMLRNNGRESGD